MVWLGCNNLKKKCNMLIKQGVTNNIYDEKLEILEGTSVDISDVIGNTRYIQLYYPVDDVIRNKGKLTLLSTDYCDILSLILKCIFKIINKKGGAKKKKIPFLKKRL